jgi:hypothetical protein
MVFLTRGRRHLATGAIVALLTPWSVPARVNQTTLENDVKAAFLYNFTKFIEWPPPSQPVADPFRLCVLADAAFTRAVDSTIADEAVDGRRLVRVEPQSVDEVRGCAILYVGREHLDRGARLLAAARDLPVLTVGEGPQFVEHGGAIGFVLENNRVRFDVSSRAVQRSGLKVSSKLLRVARSVKGGAR